MSRLLGRWLSLETLSITAVTLDDLLLFVLGQGSIVENGGGDTATQVVIITDTIHAIVLKSIFDARCISIGGCKRLTVTWSALREESCLVEPVTIDSISFGLFIDPCAVALIIALFSL